MKNLLIVIPFNLPWEWSTDYTNQTALELGNNNLVICYMWADYLSLKEYFIKGEFPILFKKYSKNIYQYYPIYLIPLRRFPFILKLNEMVNMYLLRLITLCFRLNRKIDKKILWFFDPKTEPLISYFDNSWNKLYDCVDYYIGTAKNDKDKTKISILEKKLTKVCDLVVANSTVLKRHLEKTRNGIVLVPQGFRLDTFINYGVSKNIPVLKKSKRPLIGFVGAVNYRIDYKLIYDLAIKHTEWDFAIWGPELQIELFSTEQLHYLNLLKKLSNIILGKSDKKDIPGIVKQFDIGMIPYIPDDDFNKYCYPMKLFEFFYVGKPVISIEIEELKRFPNFVRIAKNSKEWQDSIRYFLTTPWTVDKMKRERNLAIQNSWKNKVDQITTALYSKIP